MRSEKLVGRIILVVLVVLAGQLASMATADESEAVFIGTLGLGVALFHDGEHVPRVHGNVDCEGGSHDLAGNRACWTYSFHLLETEDRLRVAIESSSRADVYVVCAEGPEQARCDGNLPLLEITPPQFNRELVFVDPAPGEWIIKVVANDVEDWAFRLRAALVESQPEADLLRPNLKVWLPYEFGFVAPASPAAGSSGDRENPAGPPGVSCTPDEKALRCLRFSTGVHNVGDGPLYIRFDGDDKALQHVYYSDSTPGDYRDNEVDGNYREFDAGFGEFHPQHGHRHFGDMVLYELFEVTDRSTNRSTREADRLMRLGEGSKHGYCTSDQGLGEWRSFNQDHAWAPMVRDRGCQSNLALGKGWGDIYRWQRPGQYVPYDAVSDLDGSMRAGYYVVRVSVDPEDRLEETRENDNFGYAFIQVIDDIHGHRVVICERGFGTSPWDPNKKIPTEPFWWTIRTLSQTPGLGECI